MGGRRLMNCAARRVTSIQWLVFCLASCLLGRSASLADKPQTAPSFAGPKSQGVTESVQARRVTQFVNHSGGARRLQDAKSIVRLPPVHEGSVPRRPAKAGPTSQLTHAGYYAQRVGGVNPLEPVRSPATGGSDLERRMVRIEIAIQSLLGRLDRLDQISNARQLPAASGIRQASHSIGTRPATAHPSRSDFRGLPRSSKRQSMSSFFPPPPR